MQRSRVPDKGGGWLHLINRLDDYFLVEPGVEEHLQCSGVWGVATLEFLFKTTKMMPGHQSK